MKTTSAEVKALIHDLVLFEDDLDGNGQRIVRRQFPKAIFRGITMLRKKLGESMEFGSVEKTKLIKTLDKDGKEQITFKREDIQWLPQSQVTDNFQVFQERHTTTEIEFTEAEITAMKYCYEHREELLGVSVEALDEFEAMIGKKAA